MKVWKTFLLCALVNFCSGFYDNEEEQPGMLSIPLRRVLSPDERVESSGMAQESKIDVEMANIINYLYYGTVYVGEKRQGFRVVFDTGSDWFWVQDATRCPPKQCKAKSKFWCDSKKNCKFLGYNKTMGYLDGTKVEGQVFQDNIYLTSSSKGVGASYHGINAFRVSDPTNSPIDGLMGVGLRSEANVLQALKTAGVINDRIFTIYFYDNPYANGNVDSMVTFGGYNPSYIQGNYTYSPLVSTDTWTIEMKEFLVGDQKIALTNTKALIDTGTSYVIMPLEEFTLFTQIIKTTVSSACDFSNKEYTCPSMALTKFPTLKVKFGTQEFILEPKNYVRTEFGRLRIMVGQPTYGSRFYQTFKHTVLNPGDEKYPVDYEEILSNL